MIMADCEWWKYGLRCGGAERGHHLVDHFIRAYENPVNVCLLIDINLFTEN